MENLEKHLTIIGSCISRDTFDIVKTLDEYEPENETNYVVDRYIQRVSLFSAMSKCTDKEIADKILAESESSTCPNFFKKMLRLDVTKDWYNYVKPANSEWLVMDLANNRSKLYEYNGSLYSVNLINAVQPLRPDRKESDELTKLSNGKLVEPLDLDPNVIKQMITDWVNDVLTLFPQERIIITNIESVSIYLDVTTGRIESPNHYTDYSAKRMMEYLRICYEHIYKLLPNAHYIDLPITLIGNTRHKWGKYPLHYVDEVYAYLYRATDYIITANPSKEEERAYLETLRERYSKIIFKKYTAMMQNTLQREKNILSLSELAKSGTYSANGLTLEVANDYKFRVKGKSTQRTCFFLLADTNGNPLAPWKYLDKCTQKGRYLFTTKVEVKWLHSYIQLVLSNSCEDTKWVTCSYSTDFTIDHDYKYRLIRFIIEADEEIDVSGELILEKLQ